MNKKLIIISFLLFLLLIAELILLLLNSYSDTTLLNNIAKESNITQTDITENIVKKTDFNLYYLTLRTGILINSRQTNQYQGKLKEVKYNQEGLILTLAKNNIKVKFLFAKNDLEKLKIFDNSGSVINIDDLRSGQIIAIENEYLLTSENSTMIKTDIKIIK